LDPSGGNQAVNMAIFIRNFLSDAVDLVDARTNVDLVVMK
jgi:hypothetical protein